MSMRALAVLVAAFAAATPLLASAQQHHPHDGAPAAAAAPEGNEDTSQSEHVAPDPPQLEMHDMPRREMNRMMGMDDRAIFGHVVVDTLEWRRADGESTGAWDGYAWFGRDEGKLWIRSEGERAGRDTNADAEVLFDRNFARWWSLQAGARHDFGTGPSRSWAAFGVQGIAPYFFESSATVYIGEQGRSALRLRSEYEVLFTQRLILRPSLELNLYGKSDPVRNVGSGLSDATLGLRLRYEIRRQFAPYVGVTWEKRFGHTRDLARRAGEPPAQTYFVAGIRLWY